MEDLQKTVTICKKLLNGITEQFVGIQQKLEFLERKVKGLEREKSNKHPYSEVISGEVREQILKMLKKNKKKKQKKKEQKEKKTTEA